MTITRPKRRLFRRRRHGSDRGAALVEFALVSLPLFTILFGTIEFGWSFFQLNDVRHGAREGIRLVAVDSDVVPDWTSGSWTNGERLAQATCERMDRRDGVTIEIALEDRDTNGVFDVGDNATLTATKPLDQLTNVFDPVLKNVVLEEKITTRLEQDPSGGIDLTKWDCQ